MESIDCIPPRLLEVIRLRQMFLSDNLETLYSK
jgi:hypothetical protein